MEPTDPGHATCAPASVAIDHAVDLMSQQEMCHESMSERTFELPCTFPTVGPAITNPPDRLVSLIENGEHSRQQGKESEFSNR